MADELRNQFSRNDAVEVIQADALQVDFAPWYEQWQQKMKVVANLPYEISSPMIFRVLPRKEIFFPFRLDAPDGSGQKGSGQARDERLRPPEPLVSIVYSGPDCFFRSPPSVLPPPQVESAVVRFEILPQPSVEVEDEKTLQQVIRSAFTYRRKTLVNAMRLGEFAHLPAEKIHEALQSVRISPNSRGEALSLEQFCDLTRALSARIEIKTCSSVVSLELVYIRKRSSPYFSRDCVTTGKVASFRERGKPVYSYSMTLAWFPACAGITNYDTLSRGERSPDEN